MGKSTLAQQIAEETGLEWLDISQIAKDNKCLEGYDSTYGCHVLNEEKVLKDHIHIIAISHVSPN